MFPRQHHTGLHWPSGKLLLAIAAVALAIVGHARAEDAVLLASTVPGYVPGMVVSTIDRLSIPEGATATLLFESGDMLRLRGPFEGTIGQQQPKSGESTASALVDMFRLHGIDATAIGGTRSAMAPRAAVALDDVQIDPQQSSTYCIAQNTSVWIGRPVAEQGSYALYRRGLTRALAWPAGADRIEWPADVPIDDGSRFEIVANGASRTTVAFRKMPATNGRAQVAKGFLLGCHDQFDDALRHIRRTATSPGVWITTERGRKPQYHIGEPISLTVVTDADGYLYCVANEAAGGVRPIFPAGAIDGAQVRGVVPLSIPGRRQPVGLRASPGLTQIRCWLADRDITPELPRALQAVPTGRAPDQLAVDLDALFAGIGGTRIATDRLAVTTE